MRSAYLGAAIRAFRSAGIGVQLGSVAIVTSPLDSFTPVEIDQTGSIVDDDVQYQTGAEVIAALPTEIDVTLVDTNVVSVPITWVDTDTYDPTTAASYTFTAIWGTMPNGANNDNDLTPPITELEVRQSPKVIIVSGLTTSELDAYLNARNPADYYDTVFDCLLSEPRTSASDANVALLEVGENTVLADRGFAFGTNTTTGDRRIVITLAVGKSITVIWGDGNSDVYNGTGSAQNLDHTYATTGNEITFTGDFLDITTLGGSFQNFNGDLSNRSVMIGLTYLDIRGSLFSFSSSDFWTGINSQIRAASAITDADSVANGIIASSVAVGQSIDFGGSNAIPTPSAALTTAIALHATNGNTLTYNS